MESELRELARTLASLTREEYETVTAEARGESLEQRKQAASAALAAYRKKGR